MSKKKCKVGEYFYLINNKTKEHKLRKITEVDTLIFVWGKNSKDFGCNNIYKLKKNKNKNSKVKWLL